MSLGKSLDEKFSEIEYRLSALEKVAGDNATKPNPKPNVDLRDLHLPDGYNLEDMLYENEFTELNIISKHGKGVGDPDADNALHDSFVKWNVVALDGNSEKCIKVHVKDATHDIDENGIILRTHGYDPNFDIAPWIKESYGQDDKATIGGMISAEGKIAFKTGVFQCLVKKDKIEDGDHAALWLLDEDGVWPPEEDLFEQVPGDEMGNGLSMNVHDTDRFTRFKDITLEDWTLLECELTSNAEIIFRVNGEDKLRARNPHPDKARYPLFTFESNGNWPSSFGKRTSYEGVGSQYRFAYWRVFTKDDA